MQCKKITIAGHRCTRNAQEGSEHCWQHPRGTSNSGRPSDYKEEYAEQAYKLCLLGATDKDLANFFDVTEQTINNWKKECPEFFESMKKGKEVADANVAERLYQRAMGYEHPEDKIFQYEGDPVIVPTIKHYPPDTAAAFIWLKNRQSKKWRDKHEIEHSGEVVKIIDDIK